MQESILTSIKKLLGIEENYTHFDQDVIIHINTAFATLHDLGVGPEECFDITDKESVWNDFTNGDKKLNPVKSYVYMKVKLVFDPPLSSAVMEAMKQSIAETEWRLCDRSTTTDAEEEIQNGE